MSQVKEIVAEVEVLKSHIRASVEEAVRKFHAEGKHNVGLTYIQVGTSELLEMGKVPTVVVAEIDVGIQVDGLNFNL